MVDTNADGAVKEEHETNDHEFLNTADFLNSCCLRLDMPNNISAAGGGGG